MTNSAPSDAAVSSEAGLGFRLPRAAKLRRTRDIRRTLRRGARAKGPFVEVFSIPSCAGRPRIAIIVPKYGHVSVERNRVRRRLLEIARTVWMPVLFERGYEIDLIFRATPPAYDASFKQLHESLTGPLEMICAQQL